MDTYFSTFFTGFGDVIQKWLPKFLDTVDIELLSDGIVVYKTTSSIEQIKKLKFINNSYILLKKVDNLSKSPLYDLIQIALNDSEIQTLIKNNFNRRTKFRVRASIRNQFVTIDKNLLLDLEKKLTQISSNLILDRSLPDVEMSLSIRSEGFGLIGIRFTKKDNYEKTLAKGQLYPELANILCLISDPDKNDIFLDPFAGSAAIVTQRKNFPYKKLIAGDIEPKKDSKIKILKLNALEATIFSDGFISKVVTDPPWGLHDKTIDIANFYFNMLKEFSRITKTGGTNVILTLQKDIIETQIEKFEEYKLIAKYNTLVSGKKAGVYKILKNKL